MKTVMTMESVSINQLRDFVVRAATTELAALTDTRTHVRRTDNADGAEWPRCQRVNVTFRCDGVVRGSMSADGKGLDEQIRNAMTKAAADVRFKGPLTRKELLRSTMEIWIQTAATELPAKQRKQRSAFTLGLHGAEVARDGRSAYYKPSVSLTSGFHTVTSMLRRLCKKAGLPRDAWMDEETSVKRTEWIGIHIDNDKCSEVLRFLRKPLGEEIDRNVIAKWINLSCEYFCNHQSYTGAISYIFNPIRNEVDREPLSLLRAAGCLFSISQTLDTSPIAIDREVFDTASQLAAYLLERTRIWEPGLRIMEDEKHSQHPKVGATALVVLALSYPYLRLEYGNYEAELRASIHRCQKPDGRFMTHFGKLEEGHKQIEFYPGQVLLALALEVDAGSMAALAMVDAAFEPYSKHFDSAPTTAFVGWHIDAWSRLAAATKREDYANFAFRQADWLLVKQIVSSPIPEHIGGFGKQNDVPGFSSIVYVEALIRALRLASLYGDKRRCDRYAEAVRRGLQFCQKLQLDSIPASFFPNQEKRSGGVALKLDNLNVRCDVVQHFLTMSLAAFAHMDFIYA